MKKSHSSAPILTNADIVRFIVWVIEYRNQYGKATKRSVAAALDLHEVTIYRKTTEAEAAREATSGMLRRFLSFCEKEGISGKVVKSVVNKWQTEN
jgi:hypothetical protein